MARKNKNSLFHFRRVALLGVLITAFFLVRLDADALPAPLAQHARVLAYASEMSQAGLLGGTNNARAANGLGPLVLNAQLNNSAQMKAQDMADKDYWAHVAPDGTQPWYFFDQAGYEYIRAGENLAYGFNTSQGAVDGWMNSPSHRDNMLGNYNDVGFGFVNVANYQSNGQQTIVVAHYGAVAGAATATPTAPAATPPAATPAPVAQAPASTPSPPSAAETAPVTAEQPVATQEDTVIPKTPGIATPVPVKTGREVRVSVLSMLAARQLPLAAAASLAMVAFAVIGYALTHRVAFRHAVVAGEQFVVHHPGVDTAIVAAVTSLILMTTYGQLS